MSPLKQKEVFQKLLLKKKERGTKLARSKGKGGGWKKFRVKGSRDLDIFHSRKQNKGKKKVKKNSSSDSWSHLSKTEGL